MTVLQFASALVDSVVWPLVFLSFVLMFRQRIADLMDRTSSIVFRGTRIDFGKGFSEFEEKAAKDKKIKKETDELFGRLRRKDKKDLDLDLYLDIDPKDRALRFILVALEMEHRSPRASISTSWAGVNRELADTCERLDIIGSYGGWRSFAETSRLLHAKGYVYDDLLYLLQDLDHLEERATQSSRSDISVQQAEDYTIYCTAMIAYLKRLDRRE